SAPFSTTVYVGSGGGSLTPSSCQVSQSPNTSATAVAPGTTVTLAVTCGIGNPLTSCLWSGGISSTSCTVNVTAPSANTSYSVTPSNAAGSGTSLSTTVNVNSGGGIAGQNFCSGA